MTEIFAEINHNPFSDFDTLENVGKPETLYSVLAGRGMGLALISGMDYAEIQKTFSAIAHTFEENGRDTIALRVGDTEPIPGLTEIHSNDVSVAGNSLVRTGLEQVIFMDSFDTKEKILFAINASLVGGTVVAPVSAHSVDEAIGKILGGGYDVNRYLFADVLTYIAQQTTIQDPFSSDGSTIFDIHVAANDMKMKKVIWIDSGEES